MKSKRHKFFEWLDTCPLLTGNTEEDEKYLLVNYDGYGETHITFLYDEEEENQEDLEGVMKND